MSQPQVSQLAARYDRFAREEADGRSPLYAAITRGIAQEGIILEGLSDDRAVLDFLLTLPAEKQQPNLLLAAARHVFGTAADWPDFRRRLLDHRDAVRSVMVDRSTQTNEPARCATLLPILARLRQPLALIEIGASAGVCLLPDCYGYTYGHHWMAPADGCSDGPVFACAASANTPVPQILPQVVWRAGLDLHPLDPANGDDRAWLEALVWPEQSGRLANLRSALDIAAQRRPRVVQGDLRGDALERLCREAPADATLVCYHSAVLAYVADRAEREAFARRIMALCPVWIANEAPETFPGIARLAGRRGAAGQFLLSVNGAPVAWTDPHGAAIDWIA